MGAGQHNLRWMTKPEVKCLTDNVYYEARGESIRGMLLVAKTTINRAKNPNYPHDICKVVYQDKQFSWTATKQPKPDPLLYKKAEQIALQAQTFKSSALYFHNQTVQPAWAKYKVIVAQEGHHTFYR
jgi:N-acetylmuramoyl-L-alanine amidase